MNLARASGACPTRANGILTKAMSQTAGLYSVRVADLIELRKGRLLFGENVLGDAQILRGLFPTVRNDLEAYFCALSE